jgi:hypothetical protein
MTDKDYIDACKLWIDKHGKKLPKFEDNILYKNIDFAIGSFMFKTSRFKSKLKHEINKLFKN